MHQDNLPIAIRYNNNKCRIRYPFCCHMHMHVYTCNLSKLKFTYDINTLICTFHVNALKTHRQTHIQTHIPEKQIYGFPLESVQLVQNPTLGHILLWKLNQHKLSSIPSLSWKYNKSWHVDTTNTSLYYTEDFQSYNTQYSKALLSKAQRF